jgi:hypothetical protein
MGVGVFDSWSVSLVGAEEKVDSSLNWASSFPTRHLGKYHGLLLCITRASTACVLNFYNYFSSFYQR